MFKNLFGDSDYRWPADGTKHVVVQILYIKQGLHFYKNVS